MTTWRHRTGYPQRCDACLRPSAEVWVRDGATRCPSCYARLSLPERVSLGTHYVTIGARRHQVRPVTTDEAPAAADTLGLRPAYLLTEPGPQGRQFIAFTNRALPLLLLVRELRWIQDPDQDDPDHYAGWIVLDPDDTLPSHPAPFTAYLEPPRRQTTTRKRAPPRATA